MSIQPTETAPRLRPRMATRAWLKYLMSTTMEKREQEWELEQLLRLDSGKETPSAS